MNSTDLATTSLVLGIIGVIVSLPAWYLFITGAKGLWDFVAKGKPQPHRFDKPFTRLFTVVKEVLFHTELKKKPAIAVAHWLVMVGFLLGFILWFEAYLQTFTPRGGWPYLSEWPVYHFIDELLGIGTVTGILFLIVVRLHKGTRDRLSRFYGSNHLAARFVEIVVLVEGLGMILVKAGKIATFDDIHPHYWSDFFTMQVAKLLPASPTMVSVFALIKLLSGMVWLIVVGQQLSWGVAWHRFLAFFTIFFQRNPDGRNALGGMEPLYTTGKEVLTLDNADPDHDTIGVGTIADASWKMLLDSATCTECGRCQEVCPAWNTGKPLSPKKFITDIRNAALTVDSYFTDPALLEADDSYADVNLLRITGEGATGVIDPAELWACTNCGACVEQCPVDIEHIDHIENLRRFEVLQDSSFPSELQGLFKNLEIKSNPWGRNATDRETWITKAKADGLDVPVFGEDVTAFTDLEYLFWVGCAGAFDDQAVATTRAVVELLHTAGVKFAVLGKGETCTGDPARRAGNEFLFQMLAQDTITTLDHVFEGVSEKERIIVTTCPHCFNTFRNEYPDFGGHYEVIHHTQLLNKLVRDKLLVPIPRTPDNRAPVTYHDPCFLGRHNKIFDPPRELIGATGLTLVEMDRNKNRAFCCGAGGARMFMEEKTGVHINEVRTREALDTGADQIAVGCPFCNVMMTGGVKAVSDKPADQQPVVRDVAQMLRDSILIDGTLPTPHEKQLINFPKKRSLQPIRPTTKTKTKITPPTTAQQKPHSPDTPTAPIKPKPLAPGKTTPKAPGTAKPPAPGNTAPTAPGTAKPVAPGNAKPATPGYAVPAPPGKGQPLAPGQSKPITPGKAKPPVPGKVTPKAPGTAKPPAPGHAGAQATKQTKPTAPGQARPPVPPAPSTAQPPAPGKTTPKAPGRVKPMTPGNAKPPAPGKARPAPLGKTKPDTDSKGT